MLSALVWVKGSCAKPLPSFYQPEQNDETDQIIEETAAMDLNEGSTKTEGASKKKKDQEDTDEIEKQYNFDDYEDEGEEDENGLTGDVQSLMHFANNSDDPLISSSFQDIEEEEIEELTIKPDDAIILGVHSEEEDLSHLDVYIYEEKEDNLFIHHDIILPSFPLCVAWLDFPIDNPSQLGEKGHFAAVGTFQPEIEIWNLDMVDVLEPSLVLGGELIDHEVVKTKKKKTKKQEIKHFPHSHTGPVLSLSWNKTSRNILASGSADNQVKLWDLQRSCEESQSGGFCAATITAHKDKVAAVQFHPHDPTVLASAGYDRAIYVHDIRYLESANTANNNNNNTNNNNSKVAIQLKISADVESIQWIPHSPQHLLVSQEDGVVLCFDIRQQKKPLWTLQAHEGSPVAALACNYSIPRMFATGSVDKTVKIWDIESNVPSLVTTVKPSFQVFTLSFYEGSPWILGVGGKDKGETINAQIQDRLVVYDTKTLKGVEQRFGKSVVNNSQ